MANTPTQAQSLLYCLERATGGIGLQVNADKTEFMCYNRRGDISTLDGWSLKLAWTWLIFIASKSTSLNFNEWKTLLLLLLTALHPRDDVDRLYVSRKEGGRGLSCIEDTVDASIQRLEDYIEKHERGLITTIRNYTDNTIDEIMTTTRKQKWEGKQLYGRFKRLINNISQQKTWTWLRKRNLKRETESFLIAAQDNAIRTNHIKARIDKMHQNSNM